jgi:hypothetical protein
MKPKIYPESFCIQLRPFVDDDMAWTGELEVSIFTDDNNPLERSSYLHMKHLSDIIACAVAYMEKNSHMIKEIEKFMEEPDDDEIDIEFEPEIEYTDNNIVKLNFKSKTKGSA